MTVYLLFHNYLCQIQAELNSHKFPDKGPLLENVEVLFAFFGSCIFLNIYAAALCSYSKSSLTHKEWRFNLSFLWVSVLFLNSWRISVVPYYVTIHPPVIQKTALAIEGSSDWTSTLWVWVHLCMCAFRIQALLFYIHYSCQFTIGSHKSVIGDAFVQRVKTTCVQYQDSRGN